MKAVLTILVGVSLLLGVVLGASYSIVCTDNSAGYCTSWDVNNQQSCFPAATRLMTPSGLKSMKELKRGDLVLGMVGGREAFTQLSSWLHRSEQEEGDYLVIATQAGELIVSEKHNIATTEGYQLAEQANSLLDVGTVTRVDRIKVQGMYSPKTDSKNYFVYLNGLEGKKVLAHNYAHLRNPEYYEPFVDSIEAIWNWLDGEARQAQIHPSHAWMRNTFTILQA